MFTLPTWLKTITSTPSANRATLMLGGVMSGSTDAGKSGDHSSSVVPKLQPTTFRKVTRNSSRDLEIDLTVPL